MNSRVICKISSSEEITPLINKLKEMDLKIFTYCESLENLYFSSGAGPLPDNFICLRIFSKFFEIKIMPGRDKQYRMVIISDDMDIWGSFFNGKYEEHTITPSRERTFILSSYINKFDGFKDGDERKLLIGYYQSNQLGEFARWKEVV